MPVDRELSARYESLITDLTNSWHGIFTPDEIRLAVGNARTALEPTSRIKTHLPVLVGRYARERLRAEAQARGLASQPHPELLFVCVHNAGRSQIAAALAQHLSGGAVNVRSAGSRPSGEINALAVQVLAERGIELIDAYPKPLADSFVRAADVIVTMGCGDECPYYPGKRYEDWVVADPAGADIDTIRQITDDIQHRVTDLLASLQRSESLPRRSSPA